MRILYDSKLPRYKTPFGVLTPGKSCTLRVHVPEAVCAKRVDCMVSREDGSPAFAFSLEPEAKDGPYRIFRGDFSLTDRGLYFYYFIVHHNTGSFRLFKQGNDTNMEAGDLWSVSCVPEEYDTPDWARGAIIYQVFPDRFAKSGSPDLTGKLTPYTVHKDWNEEVVWQPEEDGTVLNNDFFGGNFRGITEKLDYIAGLGAAILYLNPIGKSFSSHRYDTGDYKTPDPMLGTEAEFAELCRQAHARGIRVILDGVYSHTGSNSLYFNRYGTFEGLGAYQSQSSPYYSWYTFYQWPNNYHSWWNFDTLPTVNKLDPEFLRFIITDEDSVVAHWLRLGADGFRLDVADELPGEFIQALRNRIREIKPDALLMGEVWEDASTKIAYGTRRRYFTDAQLDSVMNYPFRNAILDFMRGRDSGRGFKDTVMTIVENYPPQVMDCCMNLLGTHDTARILTALVDDFEGTRAEKAHRHLSRNRLEVARDRLLMASFLQFTLPGAPSIYYGDEAGMEGYQDPFNRRTFPWGREDRELQDHYRLLGALRRLCEPLRRGDIRFFQAEDRHLGYTRTCDGKTVRIYVNRSEDPWEIDSGKLLMGRNIQLASPTAMTLAARGFCILED